MVLRETGRPEVVVLPGGGRGEEDLTTTPEGNFDGEAANEILRLHQMRYGSGELHIEAKTDDAIDLQDDATKMTEALRRARGVQDG